MIKMIIVDDQADQLQRYAGIITDLVKAADLSVDVKTFFVEADKPKARTEIEEAILSERPHVVISDAKVHGDDGWGQALLAQAKTLLPEAVTCLLSREALKTGQFGLKTPNPDIIIDKGMLGGNANYRTHIRERILGALTRSATLDITWNKPFKEMFSAFRDDAGKRATVEEINSIIEQCLYDGSVSDGTKTIALEQMTGGKSGAVVMSCRLTGTLAYGVTGVIKISKKREALREAQNYNTYVKWVLPYTWKVEVLGTGYTQASGAVCYSFAFAGEDKPQSSAERLRAADPAVTPLICDTIFNPKSKAWYSQRRDLRIDASEYFQAKPFFPTAEAVYDRENKLAELFISVFDIDFRKVDEEWELFGRRAVRPGRILFTEDWGKVEECVCHGDLNANNILVNSKTSAAAFIDFQNTGYHNIYRDFISFESSLRIDWGEDLEPEDYCDLLAHEVGLSEGISCARSGYLAEIQLVRDAAFANFPETEGAARRALFLFASYIHFSWLAVRFSDFPPKAYVRLLLGAFACLEVLGRKRAELMIAPSAA